MEGSSEFTQAELSSPEFVQRFIKMLRSNLHGSNPGVVDSTLSQLREEQRQEQCESEGYIYGLHPATLEETIGTIVDGLATDNRAKLSLQHEGRSKLTTEDADDIADLSFGCLGQLCTSLVKDAGNTSAFKAALEARVNANPKQQLATFLCLLIQFAFQQHDVKVTRMLVFFLTEAILRFRTKQKEYAKLLEELNTKGLIPAHAQDFVPKLSKGHGRGNNTKKDSNDILKDEAFNADCISFLVEVCLIQWPLEHQEEALTVVNRAALRESDDDVFEGAKTGLSWFKSFYSYGRSPDAGSYSLEKLMSDCSLTEAREVFGCVKDNRLIFNLHGVACCFAKTKWPAVQQYFLGGIQNHFQQNGTPESKAEWALSGWLYNIRDFVVIEYLGGGSFGKVFLVHLKDKPLQQFALKLVAIDLVSDSFELEYLYREIVFTSKVNSTHVAKVCGFFAVPGLVLSSEKNYNTTMAIMMEYCGSSLRTFMDSPAFQEMTQPARVNWACKIIEQLLEGVKAMHDRDLTHRDLKPENICVDSDGKNIKIIDCGMIREVPQEDGTMALSENVGSEPYVAPTGRSATHDFYSVGVISCELICGKRPFKTSQEKMFPDSKKAAVADKLLVDFQLEPWYHEKAGGLKCEIDLLGGLIMGLLEPDNSKRMECEPALETVKDLNRRLTGKIWTRMAQNAN